MNRNNIYRLPQAIDELRKMMLKRLDRTDLSIRELRAHTDQSIKELREHADSSIKELREHADDSSGELRKDTAAGFAEMRREASVNMRWVMGMWLTTIASIVGLGGRVFGMY